MLPALSGLKATKKPLSAPLLGLPLISWTRRGPRRQVVGHAQARPFWLPSLDQQRNCRPGKGKLSEGLAQETMGLVWADWAPKRGYHGTQKLTLPQVSMDTLCGSVETLPPLWDRERWVGESCILSYPTNALCTVGHTGPGVYAPLLLPSEKGGVSGSCRDRGA